MLGEKRSKAAFYADSNKSVQDENTYVEQASGQTFEHGPDQSYLDALNRKEVFCRSRFPLHLKTAALRSQGI